MIQLSFMVFLVNQRTIYLPHARSEKRYVPKTTTKSIWFLSFFLLKSSIGIDSQCFISSCHVWFVRGIVLYKSLLDSFFPSFLHSVVVPCRIVLYYITEHLVKQPKKRTIDASAEERGRKSKTKPKSEEEEKMK